MTLQEITDAGITPAIKFLDLKDTPEARVMLLAIGLQESRFLYRRQLGNGPAKSYWQFERGGGVKGVLTHPASKVKAEALCAERRVAADPIAVWNLMELDDVLGAGFARLLLLTDAKALPAVHDEDGAWLYYVRNWRPGKPHIGTWPDCHKQAREFVAGK